jgi:hypothetical protein
MLAGKCKILNKPNETAPAVAAKTLQYTCFAQHTYRWGTFR